MDINFESMSDLNRTVVGAFMDEFERAADIEWPALATEIQSGSSSNLYPFMNATDGMREWLGEATFEQLASGRYSIDNRKFQKGIEADRDQIVDDADGGAGLYGSAARIAAVACASHPDELVIAEALAQGETLLCHDGQPYFDASHPNQTDAGVQSNLMGGGGTAWYVMDTSRPLKPLIYQVREPLRIDPLTDLTNAYSFTSHKFRWNAWLRDAAGFGPWRLAVKSQQTLDEAGFVAARARLEGFHMGVKDPLTNSYRSARNKATLLVVPFSLRDTARKLITQERLASGEDNYLRNSIQIHASRYL